MAFDHLEYEADRNPTLEPSLSELTLKAIDALSENKNGFVLLVEGGRIDHAHHVTSNIFNYFQMITLDFNLIFQENNAHKAIEDFVEFDETVGKAFKVVPKEETLIIVTADHSHTFTLGGNALRGNKIYGVALKNWPYRQNSSDTSLTYTSLLYGNGPGGLKKIRNRNLTNAETGETFN